MTLAATMFFRCRAHRVPPRCRRDIRRRRLEDAGPRYRRSRRRATSRITRFTCCWPLPVGWIVWHVLRRLGGAFERKAFSDIQLVVDCWFAIVTMEGIVMELTAPYGVAGMAIGAGAFAAYRVSVEIDAARSGRRLSCGTEKRTSALAAVAGIRPPVENRAALRLHRPAVALSRSRAADSRRGSGDAHRRSRRRAGIRERPAQEPVRGIARRDSRAHRAARHAAGSRRPFPHQ